MSTILLVDDEPDLLDLYGEVLELMDHRVLRAHDGWEALEIAHARRPDLVVTDWQMPRMNGMELCQQLVQDSQLRDVPIIMHSTARNPHAPGVRVFVSKCAELSEFEDAVNETLYSTAGPDRPARVLGREELSSSARATAWEQEQSCGLMH